MPELYSANFEHGLLQGEPSIIRSKWGFWHRNGTFITPDTHIYIVCIGASSREGVGANLPRGAITFVRDDSVRDHSVRDRIVRDRIVRDHIVRDHSVRDHIVRDRE